MKINEIINEYFKIRDKYFKNTSDWSYGSIVLNKFLETEVEIKKGESNGIIQCD